MFFMVLTILVVVSNLDPIPRAAEGPRLIQASHSVEMTVTTLVRCFAPRCGRSLIRRCRSSRAWCIAFCTVTELGYRVVKARDAASALVVVDSGIPIDLIFTDVMMPGSLRSPDFARKAKERLPNVAVLFTSGYTQNAIVHGGRLDPGVELLAKPYTREALARKIRHLLANQAQRRVAQGSQHSADEKSFKDATVLLVEDDDLIRLTTTEMLNDLGCNVKEASTAQEALKILDEHPVDILLTDVGLPGVSGLELARNVYARRPDLCLVLATGDSGLKSEAARLGAILVVKPYTPKSLRQGLEQAMNKRR